MVGVIALSGRLPAAIALAGPWIRPYMLGTPSLEVKSSISSLSRNPSEPAVTCDPKLLLSVVVTATALPCESTTEKCVVSGESLRGCPADAGGGGRNPSGRCSEALGVAICGSMLARQASAYFFAVSSATGMLL